MRSLSDSEPLLRRRRFSHDVEAAVTLRTPFIRTGRLLAKGLHFENDVGIGATGVTPQIRGNVVRVVDPRIQDESDKLGK